MRREATRTTMEFFYEGIYGFFCGVLFLRGYGALFQEM